jgi:hypothetical protein
VSMFYNTLDIVLERIFELHIEKIDRKTVN